MLSRSGRSRKSSAVTYSMTKPCRSMVSSCTRSRSFSDRAERVPLVSCLGSRLLMIISTKLNPIFCGVVSFLNSRLTNREAFWVSVESTPKPITSVPPHDRLARGVYRANGPWKEDSMSLADKPCVPCRGGVPPMERSRAEAMLAELEPGWQLNAEGHLERAYPFKNFVQSLEFANKVGAIAEKEGHHPDLHVAWGKCKVEIWTHKIKGLTESDFYMAAKVDRAFQSMGQASAQAPV